ncbi:MAG: hypothetical protein CSYNP_02336 [Syntrophus sp. SKADARSKE-3]|nr:hypothetical protein [Syntrophus sp. SKADARSKE-3]
MMAEKGRLKREGKTIQAMIGMSCRKHHGMRKGLCPQCASLLAYAAGRLEKCPYGEAKPTCGRCPTHCYKPIMREQIREVMRYAGPRMVWCHPILALNHLFDGWKSGKKERTQ